MPKTKNGLLVCTAAPKEELEISPLLEKINPISQIPELTQEIFELIDKLELCNENKQSLEDIYRKGSLLFKNYSKLNEEEKKLLSLIHGISKFFINKTLLRETKVLTGLIAEYVHESKKIEWKKYLSFPPLSATSPAPLIVTSAQQNLVEIQVAKLRLKSTHKEAVQASKSTTQPPSLIEVQAAKQQLKSINKEQTQQYKQPAAQPKNFVGIKLNPIKQDVVIPSYGIEMTEELAIKLAQQNAKIEDTLNTDPVATFVSETTHNNSDLPEKATQLLESLQPYLTEEDFDNLEYVLNEKNSENKLDNITLQEITNNFLHEIISPVLQDMRRYLSPERFTAIKNEIAEKNSMNQLDEQTFKEIKGLYNQSSRGLSIILERNEDRMSSISLHFKPPRNDTPIIVEEILKPNLER